MFEEGLVGQTVPGPLECLPPSPMVVAYGLSVDSTAMLVGMRLRGERPDLILFADKGEEKGVDLFSMQKVPVWIQAQA